MFEQVTGFIIIGEAIPNLVGFSLLDYSLEFSAQLCGPRHAHCAQVIVASLVSRIPPVCKVDRCDRISKMVYASIHPGHGTKSSYCSEFLNISFNITLLVGQSLGYLVYLKFSLYGHSHAANEYSRVGMIGATFAFENTVA